MAGFHIFSYINGQFMCNFVIVQHARFVKYRPFLYCCQTLSQFGCMLLHRQTEDMCSAWHICMHIHHILWLLGTNTSVEEVHFSLKWHLQPCHHQVSLHLESVNLCSSSLPPLFARPNWKTSVIILVLAQIWWDQRWPAGWGRGADGCMLRGTRQRPFRF